MHTNAGKHLKKTGGFVAVLVVLLGFLPAAVARDTDIYSVNAKQNCYVLMDSSGSMAWAVYEKTIDYGAMYDYLITHDRNQNPVALSSEIRDSINGNALYQNHAPMQKIYLLGGDPGVTYADANGPAFTGDPGHTSNVWDWNNLVDTHTLIDANGDIIAEDGFDARLTVDATGYILFDGVALPLGQSVPLHDPKTLGSAVVDEGLGGLLHAPGFHFSGYEGVVSGSLNTAESGDSQIYFFVTGNWVNMQAVLNLTFRNNPSAGSRVWPTTSYPIVQEEWTSLAYNLDYPAGNNNYPNNHAESQDVQTINAAGALKMQVHFSMFDVQGNGNVNTFNRDYVKIYDGTGATVAQYDNDNKPTNANGGWSPVITGNSATFKLASNNTTNGKGYTIDMIRMVYTLVDDSPTYLMQSRLDVAKDAMVYVVEEFRGKMNWGFASFGNNATGASIGPYLNPTDNDDANRAAIVTAVGNVTANGGTPLMEALQDIFQDGYYGRRNILDDLLCRKNYIISMTDGFPSADDDNGRIDGVTFGDWDNDKWTQDPSQYANPNPDYYDDVAHWMYTHSWMDKSEVTDPANSYENVITHHIAFGAKHPLLQDAAYGVKTLDNPTPGSGGVYLTAYNKEQLVAAFYALAELMAQSISFTAPVVSVDADNKIQNGDDLYMGLFLPKDNSYWVGNLKKFKLGDGSVERPDKEMVYDHANQPALGDENSFADDTATFWGDDTDANDNNNQPTAEIDEDGAGEVLLEEVAGYFAAGTYWNRPIYTYKGGAMTKFDRDHITFGDLGVADDATRDKLINFTHGYTYAADAVTGAPLGKRDWVMGAIIHSRPVVVDYYDTALDALPLLQRFVVVGSNDGMLHVFDDTTGQEMLAFIPEDILPELRNVQANSMYDTVDGLITLYRRDKNPKYLIFGERRGGGSYWCLDVQDKNPLNWTVAWQYTNGEMIQSWSEVKLSTIPVGIDKDTGERSFKDVAVFTAGYDGYEDYFPEPFNDLDNSGSPYQANGTIDNAEWKQADIDQDYLDNNQYDKYNPGMDAKGRGIFVVDIDKPTNIVLNGAIQLLPFSARYGGALLATGAAQTFPEMKFCFPATPSMIGVTDDYTYYTYVDGVRILVHGYRPNVLKSMYAIDVYANLFKVWYDFEVENQGSTETPNWHVAKSAWNVQKIFAANPGSSSDSGRVGGVANANDQGRKTFYSPDISWGGTKGYFVARNYYFPHVSFAGGDRIASLFFGTGDREHPKSTMIRNRFYAVYDDSAVTAKKYDAVGALIGDVTVSSAPYTESSLLNLTCDELGLDSTINDCYLGALGGACPGDPSDINFAMKKYLKTELLYDDATYDNPPLTLENGAAHENDAKGWYIVLEDQGKAGVCDHVTYQSASVDNHDGEQVLSKVTLYNGAVFFTTYQFAGGDTCNPLGNGFLYALEYGTGAAALDWNPYNNSADEDQPAVKDVTDRWLKHLGISGIPTDPNVVITNGQSVLLVNFGRELDRQKVNDPPLGLQLYYWRNSNSMQP